MADKTRLYWGENTSYGKLPNADDSSIGLNTWSQFKVLLDRSVVAGKLSSQDIVSTYTLAYTVANAYAGGVLDSNGDIHFIPHSAAYGTFIPVNSTLGLTSTYSLAYTTSYAYTGGVLAPNGDIHFIPYDATVGQKINSSGIVSTYSLAYTTYYAYWGGVLAPNGDIHFVPKLATVGQKITTQSALPFSKGTCCSPYLNKL